MALTLESISKGKAVKAPRIVLLGTEKIGKSTLASESENPIFIPIKGEQGIDDLDVAKFPTARTYDDVLEAISLLYQSEHDHKTIVIDSASTLEPLIWDKVCKMDSKDSIEKVGGGFGKGYNEALKYWREIMDGLDALREERNMSCILIGHVTVKPFTDPLGDPYDTYVFDIHKAAANGLVRWADSVLFGNSKTIVTKADAGFNKKNSRATTIAENAGAVQYAAKRILYTQKRPGHPGGGRGAFGRIPYELPWSWQALMEAVANADALGQPAA